MSIIASKKKRGANSDNNRAIVKVKNFSGTSALFNVRRLQNMLTVIKGMDIDVVEIGVDKESNALLFFMSEDRTIAYALAQWKDGEEG